MTQPGLVDVHCHLLPYVDDGARNMDEALLLLQMQKQQGVEVVITTPHLRRDMFETPRQEVLRRYWQLCREMQQLPDMPTLLLGREYHCDRGLRKLLAAGEPLQTLGDSGFVLLEFSGQHNPGDMFEYLNLTRQRGYRPVIAHAERYPCLEEDPQALPNLVKAGAWIQMNAESLLGEGGFFHRRRCERWVKEGYIHLIASDSHRSNMRQPNLGRCRERMQRKFGAAVTNQILYQNTAELLKTAHQPAGVEL